MRRTSALMPIAFAMSLLVLAPPATAAQRTFVASNGNDANPCSLTLPCRTFAAAIAQTAGAGEVIVLDSAGYGPVTITQSVSIIAPSGVFAGISVTVPSLDGIAINGPSSIVTLRGLTISGQGAFIHSGIYFTQGSKLTVEDCEISGFPISGIFANAPNSSVVVRNTVLRENDGGFGAIGSVTAVLDRVRIDGGGGGAGATNGAHLTVTNSVLTNNVSQGIGVSANTGTTTTVMVSHTTISGTSLGLSVAASGTGTAILVSDSNSISDVSFAAFYFAGLGGTETIYTSGTNTIGPNFVTASGGSLTPIGQH